MSPRVVVALLAALAGRAAALELYVPELPQIARPVARHADDGDRSFTDLRVEVGAGIAGTWSGSDGHNTLAGGWREAVSLHADMVHSGGLAPWGGFVWSLGIDLSRAKSDLLGSDTTFLLGTATLGLGYGIPFGRHVQLELMPFASAGWGEVGDHPETDWADSAGGWALAAGGRAVLAVTVDSGLQLAATGSYTVAWLDLKRDGSSEVTVESQGWSVGGLVGKRF